MTYHAAARSGSCIAWFCTHISALLLWMFVVLLRLSQSGSVTCRMNVPPMSMSDNARPLTVRLHSGDYFGATSLMQSAASSSSATEPTSHRSSGSGTTPRPGGRHRYHATGAADRDNSDAVGGTGTPTGAGDAGVHASDNQGSVSDQVSRASPVRKPRQHTSSLFCDMPPHSLAASRSVGTLGQRVVASSPTTCLVISREVRACGWVLGRLGACLFDAPTPDVPFVPMGLCFGFLGDVWGCPVVVGVNTGLPAASWAVGASDVTRQTPRIVRHLPTGHVSLCFLLAAGR